MLCDHSGVPYNFISLCLTANKTNKWPDETEVNNQTTYNASMYTNKMILKINRSTLITFTRSSYYVSL